MNGGGGGEEGKQLFSLEGQRADCEDLKWWQPVVEYQWNVNDYLIKIRYSLSNPINDRVQGH